MLTADTRIGSVAPARPSLRPLAVPNEHGGWGFLLEPIVLGIAVAPSWGGAFVAMAFLFAFLARQPLRLALQDLRRGRSYPRTPWAWLFATGYSLLGCLTLLSAVRASGVSLLIPLAIAAPLGLTQIGYDAFARGRSLLPELAGATAMSSSAAAIAIAAGVTPLASLGLAGLVVARSIPSIVYVRTLLGRAHGQTVSSSPALVLHLTALALVAFFASPLAALATAILLARAAWQLRHAPPPANRLGWNEIAFGALTVALMAIGQRL